MGPRAGWNWREREGVVDVAGRWFCDWSILRLSFNWSVQSRFFIYISGSR